MFRRITSAALWFLSGWTAGSMLGLALGLGVLPAPVLAVALAAFVGMDPRGLFWAKATNPNPRVATRLASMTNVEGAR